MVDQLGVVQICNIALSRIGSTQTITALDQRSPEAIQCNIHFAHCRDEILRAFPWPFATAYAQLTQVNAIGTRANEEWTFSYRYPTDCLTLRRILNTPATSATVPALTSQYQSQVSQQQPWRRADGDGTPYAFAVGQDDSGRLVLTDIANASATYTKLVSDTALWSPDFATLQAWRLATELAYGLAISDARRDYAQKMFERQETYTRSMAFNESQSDIPNVTNQSEFVRARFGY